MFDKPDLPTTSSDVRNITNYSCRVGHGSCREDVIGRHDFPVIIKMWNPNDQARSRARFAPSLARREPGRPRSDHLNRDYTMALSARL